MKLQMILLEPQTHANKKIANTIEINKDAVKRLMESVHEGQDPVALLANHVAFVMRQGVYSILKEAVAQRPDRMEKMYGVKEGE